MRQGVNTFASSVPERLSLGEAAELATMGMTTRGTGGERQPRGGPSKRAGKARGQAAYAIKNTRACGLPMDSVGAASWAAVVDRPVTVERKPFGAPSIRTSGAYRFPLSRRCRLSPSRPFNWISRRATGFGCTSILGTPARRKRLRTRHAIALQSEPVLFIGRLSVLHE